MMQRNILDPELLLSAYSQGWFPMADSKDGDIYWHSPDPRAIIPIYKVKTPRSVRQLLKRNIFEFSYNEAFEDVIIACADRDDTWISDEIINSYINLNRLGYARSFEAWQDGELVGGLYGVTIGKAFFGESMFSKVSNASKAAYYVFIEKLKEMKFLLLDTQYINKHTKSLGAVEISKKTYLDLLKNALNTP